MNRLYVTRLLFCLVLALHDWSEGPDSALVKVRLYRRKQAAGIRFERNYVSAIGEAYEVWARRSVLKRTQLDLFPVSFRADT
jgi:hypothetical protein